jgi:plasmid maintenance system antidote protein VapI
MSPERTERLVEEMRLWCEKHGVRHKDLAELLGISPQGVTEIFKGRNQPTGEQALQMIELLKTKPRKKPKQ